MSKFSVSERFACMVLGQHRSTHRKKPRGTANDEALTADIIRLGSRYGRGGEEILVLDGVFQDEHGDYPAGSYFRNPPGTSHVPASKDGCTIFVRLWQFREDDDDQIVRRLRWRFTRSEGWSESAIQLFDDGHENVRIERWMPGGTIMVENDRGLEALLLAGSATIEGQTLTSQSWARLPAGHSLRAVAGAEGATVWMKDAPLIHPGVPRLR